MAIVRPVTKTLISVPNWGVPITDEVNRLTDLSIANAPTPWITATLTNGWVNFDARAAQYRKIGDIVYLRGVIKNGGLATVAFNLPIGYRPPSYGNLGFIVESNINPALVNVEANGNVMPVSGSPTNYVRLEPIYFSTTA